MGISFDTKDSVGEVMEHVLEESDVAAGAECIITALVVEFVSVVVPCVFPKTGVSRG